MTDTAEEAVSAALVQRSFHIPVNRSVILLLCEMLGQ
jgi:hypothetical protein